MKIFNSIDDIINIEPTVVALGNFDGIHLGHQAIIRKAVYDAKGDGLKSAVFTFSNHPRNLLKDKEKVKGILYTEDKLRIIEELGIDYVFNIPFTENIMSMEPVKFIDELLLKVMRAREIMCGFNYRFGKGAHGDVQLLISEGMKKNFGVHVAEAFKVDGHIVSSSLIRKKIAAGDMLACQKLLGRLYAIKGEVVVGNRLGKSIGFPTSNINIDDSMVSPPNGVYVTKCTYGHVAYNSITNVGEKPTIGKYEKNIETHIFDFDKELYGKEIKVEFLDKLRDERKFDDIEFLCNQIKKDCEDALAYHKK